ncbi:MAG: hypothetical protein AAB262_01670 [Elusimicrobiota bacterium]
MTKQLQCNLLPSWGSLGKIPAMQASCWVIMLEKFAGVNDGTLAHGIDMAESQISRIRSARGGYVRTYTLTPLTRVAVLIDEARKTLTEAGVRHWLTTPNPYLNDVPPILCLRSDKELEKAKSLLASLRCGFPA